MWSGCLSAGSNRVQGAQVRAWTPKLTPPFTLAATNKNLFFFHNLFVSHVFFIKTNCTVQAGGHSMGKEIMWELDLHNDMTDFWCNFLCLCSYFEILEPKQ